MRGVSNKHCLLTFFISATSCVPVEMIKFLLFPFRYSTSIICDHHPPSFLKPKVAVPCWSNLQHKQICPSFINEALVFEMRKGGDRKCVKFQ